jgi:hypothetical protein
MRTSDFNFALIRDPKTGLIYVSLDSMVGYIRTLAGDVLRGDEEKPEFQLIYTMLNDIADIVATLEDSITPL